MKSSAFLFTVVSLSVSALTARAQTCPPDVTREVLTQRAITEQRDGHHADALTLAQCAAAARATPLLRLFIATELRALGRPAEALEAAQQCVAEVEADRSLPHRRSILRDCRAIAEALRSRAPERPPTQNTTQPVPPTQLPTTTPAPPTSPAQTETFVRVVPPTPSPDGLRVTLGGQELRREQWSTRLPVAPGRVHVEATATNRQTFARDVPVTEGGTAVVQLELPAVTARVNAPPPPSRLPSAGQWALAGAGAAMLGGALATFILEGDLREEQNALCLNGDDGVRRCLDPRGNAIDDERAPLRIANNVLFFGGIAAITGAAVWYLVARPRAERASTFVSLQVAPSPSGVVLGVRGAL